MLIGLLFALFSTPSFATDKTLSSQTQRAIKEAENLSLLKDRLPACAVLARALKKSNSHEEKLLREKLNQLSKYFFTDKGFQDYLLGKELFEKQKFSDSLERLIEADEVEKGNIDVLHYMVLDYLWLKNGALAETTSKRAQQINPIDAEAIRDEQGVLVLNEDWEGAKKIGSQLNKDLGDFSGPTLYFLGLSDLKLGSKEEGEKILLQSIGKERIVPEAYFWLSQQDLKSEDDLEKQKFISKYLVLCKNKVGTLLIERDPSVCSHYAEAEKLALLNSSAKTGESKKEVPK